MKTPIRIGLLGLNFGHWIGEELTNHPAWPVRLSRVCDLDAEKAARASVEFGVPVSPSLDALLEDPEVDAVALFTGPNGRANLIRRIIRAGKDVMTTKPFERDADAALAVLQEARDLGRVVHLNSPNARPYGEIAPIKAWIDAGRIGRLTLGAASCWVYYGATPADGSWYDDPVQCPAAPIFRLGIYPLNVLMTLFTAPPVTVQVTHSRVETQRPTPDNAIATIGFADGAILTVTASFVVGGPDYYRNTLTIAGTHGVIYYNIGPKPRDGMTQGEAILSTDDALERQSVDTHAGEYDWDFFAQRVRGEVATDVTTPEQIVAAVRVMQAISQAELSGETVHIG